jgi:hypothetical protein
MRSVDRLRVLLDPPARYLYQWHDVSRKSSVTNEVVEELSTKIGAHNKPWTMPTLESSERAPR